MLYTVDPCLSLLYVVVCLRYSQIPNLSLPPTWLSTYLPHGCQNDNFKMQNWSSNFSIIYLPMFHFHRIKFSVWKGLSCLSTQFPSSHSFLPYFQCSCQREPVSSACIIFLHNSRPLNMLFPLPITPFFKIQSKHTFLWKAFYKLEVEVITPFFYLVDIRWVLWNEIKCDLLI